MKVCLVNSFYPPYPGGAETYVSSLARELVARGHDVTVYCASPPLPAGERLEGGVTVCRMNLLLTVYGTPITLFPWSFFRERYDVIHCNFPSPYFTFVSALAREIRGTPAVLTWHNDLPALTPFASSLVSLNNRLASVYLRAYSCIIATTRAYAETSPVLGRRSDRVRVITNGVDTKRFNPNVDGGMVREKHGLSGRKVALFVGAMTTWHTYKGADVLLRAFQMAASKCDNLRLLVVGGGSKQDIYKDIARDLGVDSRVVFAGNVDIGLLPEYYAACDFAVLPSKDRSEGFGLVLLEAMATGKAVIGSRVGGVVDVIKHGETGYLVEPNRPDVLGEAMVHLYQDDEMRERMGAAGRSFAEDHDWSRVAEEVEHVYSRIH